MEPAHPAELVQGVKQDPSIRTLAVLQMLIFIVSGLAEVGLDLELGSQYDVCVRYKVSTLEQ